MPALKPYKHRRSIYDQDPAVTFGCVHDPGDQDVGVTATAEGVTVIVWVSNTPAGAVLTAEDMTEAAAALLNRRLRQLHAIGGKK